MTAKRMMIAATMAALVFAAMAVTAFTQKQKSSATQRRYINLPGRPLQAPFSDAVMVGDTLYLAGWIGIDPKTNKVPEDIDQEVRLLLDHFKDVLAEAGMTMDDLVTVQVFCPDLTKFDQFNAIYRTYFKRNFPARAFIGSGPLLLGGHFEMQATAVKGK